MHLKKDIKYFKEFVWTWNLSLVSARQLQSADKQMLGLGQGNIPKYLREDFCLEMPLFFLPFQNMSMQPQSTAEILVK